MIATYKILGQSAPSAATLTDVYIVPVATEAVVSSIDVANRSATPTEFRISVAIAGAANNDKQYIAYDVSLAANEARSFTVKPLGETDVIRVYNTLATVSFNVFGVELTGNKTV